MCVQPGNEGTTICRTGGGERGGATHYWLKPVCAMRFNAPHLMLSATLSLRRDKVDDRDGVSLDAIHGCGNCDLQLFHKRYGEFKSA